MYRFDLNEAWRAGGCVALRRLRVNSALIESFSFPALSLRIMSLCFPTGMY